MRSRAGIVPDRDEALAQPLVRPRRPEEGLRDLPPVAQPVPLLTDRDRQLLALLAAGRSTGQIAAAMLVSTNTARTRVRRLQGKLDAADRYAVVRVARGLDLG